MYSYAWENGSNSTDLRYSLKPYCTAYLRDLYITYTKHLVFPCGSRAGNRRLTWIIMRGTQIAVCVCSVWGSNSRKYPATLFHLQHTLLYRCMRQTARDLLFSRRRFRCAVHKRFRRALHGDATRPRPLYGCILWFWRRSAVTQCVTRAKCTV